MINSGNYFSIIDSVGINTLPPALAKSHQAVLRVTNNGESWERYAGNGEIKRIIDIYFDKLNDFIETLKPASLHKETKAVKQESVKTKKEKPKKTKEPRAGDDLTEPKSVARISEEVKFIKRFVGLHNKVKSREAILAFIKSLQRSIVQKLIRKTSPFAKQIELIQETLIAFYQKMKPQEGITIDESKLSKFVAIAGGEKVYPSLNIIKRYIGLQGKPIDKNLIDRIVSQIEKAMDKKIMSDDPYADKVKEIYNTLRKSKSNKTFSISSSELNGLSGIVKGCQCQHKHLGQIYRMKKKDAVKAKKTKRIRECNHKTYSDARGKGTCSHNGGLSGISTPAIPTNGRILTAEQMGKREHDLLNFTSHWLALFGRPERNFALMLHGEPHNGKTIFLLMFAKYLAENFGFVLYVTSEEFESSTMTQKINDFITPKPFRLHFAETLEDIDLSPYQFVILDSVNDLKLRPDDYKAIVKQYPGKGYILNLQHTKTGLFKGGKDWEHIPGIVAEVSKGSITLTKNRYGNKGALNFFKQFGLEWKEPEPIEDAVEVKDIQGSDKRIDTAEDEVIY
jgi:hypothetical protein